jgi:uncharacterized protein (TIGR00299 family) protein
MRALYVDPVGGAAGDMLLAALLDLGTPLPVVEAALATLELPAGSFELRVEPVATAGLEATRVSVVVPPGPAPERTLRDIHALLATGDLAPRVRERARLVFERLAAAEARVHAVPVDHVHFHEVGAVDAIVDVVATVVALEWLGIETLRFGLLAPGNGVISSAHGALPLPAPATLELLTGIPIRLGGPPGEWVTPTAAAILTALGAPAPPDFVLAVEKVGLGAGHRPRADRPNLVRALIGEMAEPAAGAEVAVGEGVLREEIVVLAAAIDDEPPTALAHAVAALRAEGALDVTLTPMIMKKGRAGTELTVLARPEAAEALARTLLRETTTLGLRLRREERRTLSRRLVPVETPYGPVRMKETMRPGVNGATAFRDAAPESDDVAQAAVAHGVPFPVVAAAARAAWAAGPGRVPAGESG